MKTNLRFVSPLLVLIAACAVPLVGCKRLAIDALDRATEAAFNEASDGGGDLRVGHLPDDFPKDAPIDPKATVWTSMRISEANGTGWVTSFTSDESPEQVLAFYDKRLKRIEGDAGPALPLSLQMLPPGVSMQMDGLQKTQTMHDQDDVVQTQVTTLFAFRSEGQIIVTTIHRDGPRLQAHEKATMILVTVATSGRRKE